MCKYGDIIVVNKFKGEDGKNVGRHSFVVIYDEAGTISGLEYDFVANVISSFKDNKNKKKSYKGNYELLKDAIIGKKLKKESYIKVDQAYYFNKKNIDYYVFGELKESSLDELKEIIIDLSKEGLIKRNIENLITKF